MPNLREDFDLITDNDIEFFADSIECSKALISSLKNRLNKQPFNNLTLMADDHFFGNISCRYCGQSFNSNSIWVGLYFNNITFTQDYKLVLAIWEGNDDNNIKKSLSDALVSYKSQYFKPVDERWIFVNLDNYLLVCDTDGTALKDEIKRKVSKIQKDSTQN